MVCCRVEFGRARVWKGYGTGRVGYGKVLYGRLGVG